MTLAFANSPNSTLIRNDQTLSTALDAGVVIMDMDRGMYYALEHAAARVWALTELPITIAALCERLVAEYDITPEHCVEQVLVFVEDLRARGLVRVV